MVWHKYNLLAVAIMSNSFVKVEKDGGSVQKGVVKKDIQMNGKTVFITGGNNGIGYETARDLAKRGAKVIIACRSMLKGQAAKERILNEISNANIKISELDLSSLKSVTKCATETLKTEERLDVLINNAGIMMVPYNKTEDGFESQLGVNHIGHFALTNLLLPLLKKSAPSRIVVVASSAHLRSTMNWDDLMSEKSYSPQFAYGQSKLANILFARELSHQLKGTRVTCNSLHPGVVNTNLFDGIPSLYNGLFGWGLSLALWGLKKFWFISPIQGAQTQIYCTVAPEIEDISGKYFDKCAIGEESIAAKSDESARKLWKITEKLVAEATVSFFKNT